MMTRLSISHLEHHSGSWHRARNVQQTKMKLLFKVNILLVIVFLLGLAASYTEAERLLLHNARSEQR